MMQKLTVDDEISSNPGLLSDFKLLKASSNSSFWRVYSCNIVSETFMKLKFLGKVAIEDTDLGTISVKSL